MVATSCTILWLQPGSPMVAWGGGEHVGVEPTPTTGTSTPSARSRCAKPTVTSRSACKIDR
eukprot:scaffold20365_cov48-Phaeocystis_antarctica.AAC.1